MHLGDGTTSRVPECRETSVSRPRINIHARLTRPDRSVLLRMNRGPQRPSIAERTSRREDENRSVSG